MGADLIMSPPASLQVSPQQQAHDKGPKRRELLLDLSDLPPLIQPTPPSNTLLITNLNNPATFQKDNLERIRGLLSRPVSLNSFSPLKSFRRIIVSYPTIEAAVEIRQLLDGNSTLSLSSSCAKPTPQANELTQSTATSVAEQSIHIVDDTIGSDAQKSKLVTRFEREDRIRVYYGEATPVHGVDIPFPANHIFDPDDPNNQAIDQAERQRLLEEWDRDRHLKAPSLGKLLFISPPPSPPCGWEVREEDPPNKVTHAEDLQRALAGLLIDQTTDPKSGDQRVPKHNANGNRDGSAPNSPSTPNSSPPLQRPLTTYTRSFSHPNSDLTHQPVAAPASLILDTSATPPEQDDDEMITAGKRIKNNAHGRGRASTLVYHPRDHSDRLDLPAVLVSDMSFATDADLPFDVSCMDPGILDGEGTGKKIFAHTSRPPVELI